MPLIRTISPANLPKPQAALRNGHRDGKIVCCQWWSFGGQSADPCAVKQVHKYLFPYLTTQCQRNPPKEITEVDLHAIAVDGAANETIKVDFQLQNLRSGNAADFQRSL